MDNLDYIEELGIGVPAQVETEPQGENTSDNPEEDFVQEPEETKEPEGDEANKEDTEPSEIAELRQMVEKMEKRIADKDKYIEELRSESINKEKEDEGTQGEKEEEDFWDDPVKKYKELQDTIRIQQMQIQETIYANTVDGYWKTVNEEKLREAVSTDKEFAEEFNRSKEPYKTAYEYLSKKEQGKIDSEKNLREQIRQELLEEMGKTKPKKETVPSTPNMSGKSAGSKAEVPDDGFASVFGQY